MSHRACLLLFLPLLGLIGCASSGSGMSNTDKHGPANSAFITFLNNTPFRTHITVGSMAVELEPIPPGGKITVPNIYSEAEAFYYSFDIPLLTNSFDLLNVRPAGTGNYVYIDNAVLSQEISINTPPGLELSDSYIVITNSGQTGGVFISENQSSRLVCVHDHKKSSVSQGESEVFSIRPGNDKVLFVTGAEEYAIPSQNYLPAWVYYFIFDGTGVIPTDARPLREIGKARKVALDFAGYPMSAKNKQIVTDGLRDSLGMRNIPLEPGAVSFSAYHFTISIDITKVPPAPPVNATLLRAVVELVFSLGGNVLYKTNPINITELNETLLFSRIAEQLKHEHLFFNNIGEVIKP